MSHTLHRSFPVARCPHRCDDCGRVIAAGERYHRWKGLDECWAGIATLKECAPCFARYTRHLYLDGENRAAAEQWLAQAGGAASEGRAA